MSLATAPHHRPTNAPVHVWRGHGRESFDTPPCPLAQLRYHLLQPVCKGIFRRSGRELAQVERSAHSSCSRIFIAGACLSEGLFEKRRSSTVTNFHVFNVVFKVWRSSTSPTTRYASSSFHSASSLGSSLSRGARLVDSSGFGD